MKLRTRLALWFIAAIFVTVMMSFALGSQVWRLFYSGYDVGGDAQRAIAELESGGPRQLSQWLRQERRKDGVYRMLIDDTGRVIGSREGPPPPRLREALEALEGGANPVQMPGGAALKAVTVFTNDGRKLRWVAVIPPPHGKDLRLIDTILLLAIGVIVVSVLAWYVARRITQPIAALQDASRAVAAGQLDARVSEATSGRRDEIGALGRDFNHMAGRLQRLIDAQRQLLRDISHELRSPLARLRIAAELARDTHGEAQFDRIEQEAARLEEMIAQLLLIARLEHADVPLASEPVALDELLDGICDDARFEAASRQVEVQAELATGLLVEAPPALLQSALENVVRNAVRYGGERSTVEVTLGREQDRAVVCVADRGPGIPDDQLEAVFQPFVRVSEARDRASGGYGLGLAIAKRVVDAARGQIRASNRTGGGLSVRIELPLAPPHAPSVRPLD